MARSHEGPTFESDDRLTASSDAPIARRPEPIGIFFQKIRCAKKPVRGFFANETAIIKPLHRTNQDDRCAQKKRSDSVGYQ